MGMTWGQNPLMTLRNSESLLQESVSQEINILSWKNILDIHIQNVSLLLKNNKLKDLPIQLCFASFCLPCALDGSSVFLYKLPLSFFFLERSLIQASYFTLCLFREHEARVWSRNPLHSVETTVPGMWQHLTPNPVMPWWCAEIYCHHTLLQFGLSSVWFLLFLFFSVCIYLLPLTCHEGFREVTESELQAENFIM